MGCIIKKIILNDLGGGTLDVSILEIYKNIMEVRAVSGDNYLGGEDFTDILVNMFLNHNKLDINDLDSKTLAIIKKNCEKAKIEFSTQKVVTIKCNINNVLLKYEVSISELLRSCF